MSTNKKKNFSPLQFLHLEQRPAWWLSRLHEIDSIVNSVKIGEHQILLKKENQHCVHALLYGVKNLSEPILPWSPAASSGDPELYKSSGYSPQRIMLISGIHGAEPEGVVANLNLISLLENGVDLRGKERPKLVDLLNSYQIAIIPCLNPDGRNISPDHLRGASMEEFRAASQGVWDSGICIEWQESKRYFPLPLDKVQHPGGYPNEDGYNIMHDCAPGNLRTSEAKAILQFTEKYQPDFILNLHSCEFHPFLMASALDYPHNVRRNLSLMKKVFNVLNNAGLLEENAEFHSNLSNTININTAMMLNSGALTSIFESTTCFGDFEQILEAHYLLFETVLEDGLKERFSPRTEIVKEKINYL